MKRVFLKERAELIRRNKLQDKQLLTEELAGNLPDPFREYLKICGFLNTRIPVNADVYWSESYLKLSPSRDWGRLKTIQFNSVDPIGRVAYMKFLAMPVAGRDIYHDGYGEMKGKLLGLFRVIYDNSHETARSALLTTFCEFLLVPGYLFSENVKWEKIDNRTVRGTLSDNGIRVSAIFHFGEDGLLTHVETEDRYYSEGRGKHKKVKFSAVVESYKKQGELQIPERMKAAWHFPGGDYEYFRGTIERVDYNISS
jgi:hypothetical protein